MNAIRETLLRNTSGSAANSSLNASFTSLDETGTEVTDSETMNNTGAVQDLENTWDSRATGVPFVSTNNANEAVKTAEQRRPSLEELIQWAEEGDSWLQDNTALHATKTNTGNDGVGTNNSSSKKRGVSCGPVAAQTSADNGADNGAKNGEPSNATTECSNKKAQQETFTIQRALAKNARTLVDLKYQLYFRRLPAGYSRKMFSVDDTWRAAHDIALMNSSSRGRAEVSFFEEALININNQPRLGTGRRRSSGGGPLARTRSASSFLERIVEETRRSTVDSSNTQDYNNINGPRQESDLQNAGGGLKHERLLENIIDLLKHQRKSDNINSNNEPQDDHQGAARALLFNNSRECSFVVENAMAKHQNGRARDPFRNRADVDRFFDDLRAAYKRHMEGGASGASSSAASDAPLDEWERMQNQLLVCAETLKAKTCGPANDMNRTHVVRPAEDGQATSVNETRTAELPTTAGPAQTDNTTDFARTLTPVKQPEDGVQQTVESHFAEHPNSKMDVMNVPSVFPQHNPLKHGFVGSANRRSPIHCLAQDGLFNESVPGTHHNSLDINVPPNPEEFLLSRGGPRGGRPGSRPGSRCSSVNQDQSVDSATARNNHLHLLPPGHHRDNERNDRSRRSSRNRRSNSGDHVVNSRNGKTEGQSGRRYARENKPLSRSMSRHSVTRHPLSARAADLLEKLDDSMNASINAGVNNAGRRADRTLQRADRTDSVNSLARSLSRLNRACINDSFGAEDHSMISPIPASSINGQFRPAERESGQFRRPAGGLPRSTSAQHYNGSAAEKPPLPPSRYGTNKPGSACSRGRSLQHMPSSSALTDQAGSILKQIDTAIGGVDQSGHHPMKKGSPAEDMHGPADLTGPSLVGGKVTPRHPLAAVGKSPADVALLMPQPTPARTVDITGDGGRGGPSSNNAAGERTRMTTMEIIEQKRQTLQGERRSETQKAAEVAAARFEEMMLQRNNVENEEDAFSDDLAEEHAAEQGGDGDQQQTPSQEDEEKSIFAKKPVLRRFKEILNKGIQ